MAYLTNSKRQAILLIGLFTFCPVALAKSDVLKISLADAEARALKNSREINKAREQLSASEAALSTSWSNLLPTLEASLTAGTHHDRQLQPGEKDIPLVARDRNVYRSEVVLTQPIFSGFSSSSAIKAKKAAKTKNIYLLEDATAKLRKDIATLYLSMDLKALEISVEKEVSELRQKQLNDVQNRARNGRATDLEVLQASYSVQSQIPNIKLLQIELEKLSLQFARLTGLALDQAFVLTDKLPAAEAAVAEKSLPTIAEAYKRSLVANPNYQAKLMEYEESRNSLGEKTSTHLPSLDVVLAAGTDAQKRNEIGTPDSLSYSGEVRLTVPLFSGLSSFSDREESYHSLQSLLEDIALERESILEELTSAFKEFAVAKDRIAAEKLNVELAGKSIKKAETFYAAGRATLTEVLDSYGQRVTASKQLGSAMYDKMAAYLNIRYLIGSYRDDMEN